MGSVFYHKLGETSFMAPKNKELYAKVIETLGEPSQKFGGIVIRYNTDKAGNLYQDWTFDLFAFVFSTDKFPILKQLHKEWGLMDHDIILTCSDGQYQKMAITLARECLWRSLPQEKIDAVIDKAQTLHEKQLAKQLGKTMSDQEIMVSLGLIKAPETIGAGGGVYNPFGNAGQQMLPGQNNFAGQTIPGQNQANPAVNLAAQVGNGLPQNSQFNNLVKK